MLTAAIVLSWITWGVFVLGAVMLPNYVRIGGKNVRNPYLRGIMAAVAFPAIGSVFAGVGWFLLLPIHSLF